ncbi:glycine oxidase [Fulvimarina manganoxydans]|uniref:Glycine oxidase n=1 Tax=Fulvimarina manganoxydans TaxID=937218 RepID=A0A1W2AG81_9HYPH|nr:glycine oxidase [Fulvimarina manganoxydans]
MALSIAILGAGVTGLVAATRFAEAGYAVTVYERAETLGVGAASWLAGGMLAPFCEAESAEDSIVEPGLSGIEWWDAQAIDLKRKGTLVLAPWRDQADLKRFARRTRDHERLDGPGIAALEPDLSGRFSEALFFAREGHLDPRMALDRLAARLMTVKSGEAPLLRFGMAVEPATVSADVVLDCRGAALSDEEPDLRLVRGEMLILKTDELTLSRPIRLLHPRSPIYVVPRGESLFMVGATMVESADRRGPTLRGIAELLNAAYALHPAFAEAELIETGAGLRPAYPDNLPRARRSGRVIRLNGMYRHGFLLAPSLAEEALNIAKAFETTNWRQAS